MKHIVKNYLIGYDEKQHELYPKPNCPKCHGRGAVGRNLTTKEYQECTCLRYRDKVVKSEPDVSPYKLMLDAVEPVQRATLSIPETVGEV